MKKKVGIPRSLFYYQFYPLWKTFFEELGAEIVLSDKSNKSILDGGVKACVDEACLPVKLYHGHILNLKERVDYLFIPRFTSISRKEYVCPKFGGLPDMIKNTVKDLPVIIDTEIDLRKSRKNGKKAALEIGSYFSKNTRLIHNSYEKALSNYKEHLGMMKIEKMHNNHPYFNNLQYETDKQLKIAVIGHVYNLYDSYFNMNIFNKLGNYGVDIVTADMVDSRIIREKSELLTKKVFWYFGRKALGSILHFIDTGYIDGIIYLMSFGCGVDSFISDLAMRRLRSDSQIPFMILTLDEHSGEAGLNTRLEAFIDMINLKRHSAIEPV